MQIQTNVQLRDFTTMRLGGPARHLTIASSKDELVQAVAWAEQHGLPLFVLGGGSNVIVRDRGYDGLVIVNRIMGFDEIADDDTSATYSFGAGENWDSVVERTVSMGLSGIEAMSAIPGTVGATPVQNVGAYGQEIADTFVELEAYDTLTRGFVRLLKDECGFAYRTSIFKATENRRYIITAVTLRLLKKHPEPPFYDSLQRYFEQHDIDVQNVGAQDVRDAVIKIRATKLPDPSVIANTGSFFKNPIVPAGTFAHLQAQFPDMPHYPLADGRVKLAAGWLIEQAGLKGYDNGAFGTYEHNALVIINKAGTSETQLESFKRHIIDTVRRQFGVTLEQEPELL